LFFKGKALDFIGRKNKNVKTKITGFQRCSHGLVYRSERLCRKHFRTGCAAEEEAEEVTYDEEMTYDEAT
jgi:hypothetical protein